MATENYTDSAPTNGERRGIDQSLTKGDLNMLIVNAQTALEMAEEFVQPVPIPRDPMSHSMDLYTPDRRTAAQKLRDEADRLDRQDAAARGIREVRRQLRVYLGMSTEGMFR